MFRINHTFSAWLVGAGLVGAILFFAPFARAQTPQQMFRQTVIQNHETTTNEIANNVRLLGHIGGPTDAVAIAGQYAYIGEGSALSIVDISDAAQPQLVGKTESLPGFIEAIAVNQNMVYIAAGVGGLRIFDVTDPTNPLRRGFYEAPDNVYDIYVVNNYAYLAADDAGLRVIDVRNPAVPIEVSFFDTPELIAASVSVSGHYAYVIGVSYLGLSYEDTGLYVIDIQDPNSPGQVGYINAPDDAGGVVVDGQVVYIARSGGLWVVDATDPTAPTEIAFHATSGVPRNLDLARHLVYMAEEYAGIRTIDVTDPTHPREVGLYSITGLTKDIVVAQDVAYVAGGYAGLLTIDLADPIAPREIGRYDPAEYTAGIYADNGYYVYVVAGEQGLRILDIRNPARPVEVADYDTPGNAQDVQLIGHRAFVADGSSGLRIIDVTNPLAPTEIGAYDTPNNASGLYMVANLAYIADGASGLRIIDVTNPTTPSEIAAYDTPGLASDVAVYGTNAYVADWNQGLRIIDVDLRKPTSPIELSFFQTDDATTHIQANWRYAYFVDGVGGLRILDVQNAASPAQVGVYLPPGSEFLSFSVANDVVVSGNYAYVAAGSNGLRVIDVSDPTSPEEVGFYDPPGYLERVYVANRTIYVTSRTGELYLMRYPACYRLTLDVAGAGALPAVTPASSAPCQAGEYLPGSLITLSATPATGWQVASWIGTNNDNTTSIVNQLTMPAADLKVVVNYTPICYPLTLSHMGDGANPTATPANSTGCAESAYIAGQTVTLQADPGIGYTVAEWHGTANDTATTMTNSLTIPAVAHSAHVTYALDCYQLTVMHTGSGSDPGPTPAQSPNCPLGQYNYATAIAFNAAPAQGWVVNAWSGTNNNLSATSSNSTAMPAADHSVAVHYGEVAVKAPGDIYELDSSCTRSTPLTTDGSEVQTHTFHEESDVDWVRFDTAAGIRYRVEVVVPENSTADVVLELYGDCENTVAAQSGPTFSVGARLDISRTVSGPTYLRLSPTQPNNTGSKAAYEVSVRNISAPPANRAVIIVAGRLNASDPLQLNIEHVAKRVYELFQKKGYHAEDTFLLSTDTTLVGRNGAPTSANLKAAITTWAPEHVANGVLTLYMIDHGAQELFYLDNVNQERVTPTELNEWLKILEQKAVGVKINVIIEACQSGSFIAPRNGSISSSGRVVLTSSSDIADAGASATGAYFSDHLLTWLQQDYSVYKSFEEASIAAKKAFILQEAWLDATGDGISNQADDYRIAAQRGFAFPGTLPGNNWAPEIFAVTQVDEVTDGSVRVRVDARDDVSVHQVWGVVYPPNYIPPATAQVLQPEILPTFLFQRVDGDKAWEAQIVGLQQQGKYRLVVHADDSVGMVARPMALSIDTRGEQQIYLPSISR